MEVMEVNTLDDLLSQKCVPNETEDINLNAFTMITGTNKSNPLTNHISSNFRCKFDSRKCNVN